MPGAVTAQTGSRAPYLRGPPPAPGAASSPAGAARTSRLCRAPIPRDSTQRPLQVPAVGEERAVREHRRELEPAGPLRCLHPARLPLKLGTAAGHSLPSAQPPPHRTPPKFPTSDPHPAPLRLGSKTLGASLPSPLTLDPRPPAPQARGPSSPPGHDAQVGGTEPGELEGRGDEGGT